MLQWQYDFLAVVAQAEARDRASAASSSASATPVTTPTARGGSASASAVSASAATTGDPSSPQKTSAQSPRISTTAATAFGHVQTGMSKSLSPALESLAAQVADPTYELFACIGAPPDSRPPEGQALPRRGAPQAWCAEAVVLCAFSPSRARGGTFRTEYSAPQGDAPPTVLAKLPALVTPDAQVRCTTLAGAPGAPQLAAALDDMFLRRGALESTEGAYLARVSPGAEGGGRRRPMWVICVAADELLDEPPPFCEGGDGDGGAFRRAARRGAAMGAGGQRRYVVTRRVYVLLTRQALFATSWGVLHALAERRRLHSIAALCAGVGGLPSAEETLRRFHGLEVPMRGERGIFEQGPGCRDVEVPRAAVPDEAVDAAAHAVLRLGAGALPMQDGMPPRRWSQEAEEASALEPWAVPALCASLSVDNIVLLMSAALLEYQVFVTAKNLGVLTASVVALAPLLWPLLPMAHLVPLTAAVGDFERRLLKAGRHQRRSIGFVAGTCAPERLTKAAGVSKERMVIVDLGTNRVRAPMSLVPLPGAEALAEMLRPSHQVLWDTARVAAREGLADDGGTRGGGMLGGLGLLRRAPTFATGSESAYMSRAAPGRPLHAVTLEQTRAAADFVGVMRGYIARLMRYAEGHVITQAVPSGDGGTEKLRLFLRAALLEGVSGASKGNKDWMEALCETRLLEDFIRAHQPSHLDILGRTLVRLPSLSGLSFQSIQQILDALKPIKLRKGKYVFRQGAPSDGVYFVTRGTCGVYVAKADAEGRLRLPGERVALLETGSFFGEMSTRRTGRTASIIVESHRCELMHLAKEDWDGILVRDSNFAEKVATTAEGRFQENAMHEAARIVNVCTLFSQGNEGTSVARALFPLMQLRTIQPCELIVRRGEVGREMFFVYDGIVEVLLPAAAQQTWLDVGTGAQAGPPPPLRERTVRLTLGDFFGEGALVRPDSRRNADVRAGDKGAQVLCLAENDFARVMQGFPKTLRAIRRTATHRQASTMFLTRGSAQLLQECPFLKDHPELCDELFEDLTLETRNAGEVICAAGDVGNAMWFVHSGECLVELGRTSAPAAHEGAAARVSSYGERVVVLDTGSYFGEMALLREDSRRVATVRAGRDGCQVLRLDHATFLEGLKRHPSALEAVKAVAEARLQEIEQTTE